jgi:hypothetical protein
MTRFGLALAAFVVGAMGALLATKGLRWATHLGAGGAAVDSVLGLVPAVLVLSGRDLGTVELPWSMPGGALSLGIDPPSAFFLVIFHDERDEVAGAGGRELDTMVVPGRNRLPRPSGIRGHASRCALADASKSTKRNPVRGSGALRFLPDLAC